ncbi:LPXTG cell wall anchor domain-containing protein [Streptomyces sp. NPDC051909]|uniref:LPXTG cell wall anchor domain-containing protein n=1 Tax=Streptomyces sp. NPDC051909 TaxID=3154944 RepID=UPI0034317461
MRRSLISAGALVAAVAGSLVLAPAASAADVPFHHAKDLPISASSFEKTEKVCDGIPSTQDGWHFVLAGSPGNEAEFTKLTVTFDNGTPIVITDFSSFGNPEGKHAYVGSEIGAKLTSATAEIDGVAKFFNLSHTCPGTAPTPTGTPSTSTSPSTSESPSSSTSPSTSVSPSSSVSPSASESGAAGGQPTPSASGSAGAEGDLAETGSSAPVGIIAGVAVALAAAGAFLVTRRRKAQQH